MLDQLKKILNEDQDPKAIEKITSKLSNLLMSNEEVGYIAVQKKPAITVFPDSIVVTNKRIILCKPKNLGLSMAFIDYNWDDVAGSFMKEGILGAEFTFTTKTDLTHTVDYLPKNQARKLYTFAKEQLEILKTPQPAAQNPYPIQEEIFDSQTVDETQYESNHSSIEEIQTEEVVNFAEIMSSNETFVHNQVITNHEDTNELSVLNKDQLFEKLQNYKKLLDNGLILQGEYDKLKSEVLKYM